MSNAERIRLICWLPFPIVVNTRKKAKSPKIIENGIAILIDLDRKMYVIRTAMRHAIAVRVPEGNMAHAHALPTIKKKYLCFLILLVIPKIMNATAVEAMPMPKLAASPYIEK